LNYLGHLYFSGNNHPMMLANLFGDFVKGKDYTYLPKIVQNGVLLHRQIDDYIDNHSKVTELRLKLYSSLPKIAGIAIDLYFDHLLAKSWSVHHNQKLNHFIDDFLAYALNKKNQAFKNHSFVYPERYIHLLHLINDHNWMKRYVNIEGLEMASKGLSKRISFNNNLDQATRVFLQNEEEIQLIFNEYMKDAKQKFNTPSIL